MNLISSSSKSQPQSLSLIISSTHNKSSSSLYPPPPFTRLRRHFLGTTRNLRTTKCTNKKHYCSPKLIIKSSHHSSFVFVSVVAVSALTALYLNYSHTNKKMKKKHKLLPQQPQPGSADVQGNRSLDVNLVVEMSGVGHEIGDNVALLQKQDALTHEHTLITDTLLSPNFDILTSSITELVSTGTSEHSVLSSLPSLSEPNVLPITFGTKQAERNLEGYEQAVEFGSELAMLISKTHLTPVTVPPNNSVVGVDVLDKPADKTIQEVGIGSCQVHVGDSVRRDLYTFYEENQSATSSLENFNGLKPTSSRVSFSKTRFSSRAKSSKIGAKISMQDVLHIAGNYDRKSPVGCSREVSFLEAKDSGKRLSFSTQKEKGISHLNDQRNLLTSSSPNGTHISNKRNPSQRSSAYIRFLKDGRLMECLELLEDMERQKLLDMDQIYHAGFFRACRSQKAVKEAFRFIKLIPNPTLSTFNMLLSVCASSQDLEGAFEVMQFVQGAGLKADCKLYTTLISTCAKCGKVDAMFKVFHEMVNAEVEPNVHTYGALIDGCAKAGQVAKAFGAYGIMRSKNVKPDRVVFNALITACGQSGAVDRAFDVLAEMRAETIPIDPDHVTVGALIKACTNAGQIERAQEVYKMLHQYCIKGTPELYTIAVNSCSQTGDWDFACHVYSDMTSKGVVPDEMFISAFVDVAGHSGKLESAYEILQEARGDGMQVGIISYSSLMGACSNAKNWQKALELYEEMSSMNLKPTVSTMNALITALCDGNQLQKAVEVLFEMKKVGLCPNTVTYSMLLVACEKKDDLEVGLMLLTQAKKDDVSPNLVMCRCLFALCLRRFERSCTLGEAVLSFNSGRLQIESKWTSLVLRVYREAIIAGVVPTTEEFSQVLGCLRLPHDVTLRNRLTENLGFNTETSKGSNLCSLLDGFGEYDPRAFSLLEEAASLGIVPSASLKESPLLVDLRNLQVHSAEVYILTVLKGLKHRLAAGVKLPNINILLPIDETKVQAPKGEKTIKLAGRISRAVAALLRRLGIAYIGSESFGKIRINGVVVRKWLQPKLTSPFRGKPADMSSSQFQLGRGISHQQRNIRTGDLSLE